MQLQEKNLRRDIAERLHIIAAAIEDGTIDLRHLDILMLALPKRFVPSALYKRYERWRVTNGTVTQ